jgi:hypothetical protein
MSDEISMEYDAANKSAVLKFKGGRTLRLANVTEDQAKQFVARHAPEFQRRECILHTVGGIETREVA